MATTNAEKQKIRNLVVFSVGFLALSAAFAALVIYSREVSQSGLGGGVWFALVVFIALLASAFLFGVLRSAASVRGTANNMNVELGGPAAFAAFIIYFGMQFGQPDDLARFRVAIEGGGPTTELSGSTLNILTNFGVYHAEVDTNGYATLPNVPARAFGSEVRLRLDSDGGYTLSEESRSLQLNRDINDLLAERTQPEATLLQQHFRIPGNKIAGFLTGNEQLLDQMGNPLIEENEELFAELRKRMSEEYISGLEFGRDISSIVVLRLTSPYDEQLRDVKLVGEGLPDTHLISKLPPQSSLLILSGIYGLPPGEDRFQKRSDLQYMLRGKEFRDRLEPMPPDSGYSVVSATTGLEIGYPPSEGE